MAGDHCPDCDGWGFHDADSDDEVGCRTECPACNGAGIALGRRVTRAGVGLRPALRTAASGQGAELARQASMRSMAGEFDNEAHAMAWFPFHHHLPPTETPPWRAPVDAR